MAAFCAAAVPIALVLWPPDPGSGLADAGHGPASPTHLLALFAALGAATFAPHVLTSLCARELSDADVGSTAMGLVKAVGQVGGALAGSPVAVLAVVHGWSSVGLAAAACCAVSALAYSRVRA
jgi:sugar phosphate permease